MTTTNLPSARCESADAAEATSTPDELGRRIASFLPREPELSPAVVTRLEAARLLALDRRRSLQGTEAAPNA